MIDERRKGDSKSYTDAADLLSILTQTEFYNQQDDNLIIDEIFTFFVAGMRTI